MLVRFQERKVRAEHLHLLEITKEWTEEACHQLQSGERLSHHNLTLYRYFCMAILLIKYSKSEKTVVDFKVSYSRVPSCFPVSFTPRTIQVSLPTKIILHHR